MNDNETYEEAFQFFFAEYFIEGRNKKRLIKLLRAWPDAAPLMIDEIVEHLENPRKQYLGKYNNVGKMLRDEDIVRIFQHGPLFGSADTNNRPDQPALNWGEKSYDEKIAIIAESYPRIKRTYLEKIISSSKKQ